MWPDQFSYYFCNEFIFKVELKCIVEVQNCDNALVSSVMVR